MGKKLSKEKEKNKRQRQKRQRAAKVIFLKQLLFRNFGFGEPSPWACGIPTNKTTSIFDFETDIEDCIALDQEIKQHRRQVLHRSFR